jgi:signal transduction histidine kinase
VTDSVVNGTGRWGTGRSLRARILLGASLWTLGFFFISGVAMMWMLGTHPRVPDTVHHIFAQTVVMGTVAVALMIVGFLQLRRGLASLASVRASLSDVHAGRARRMEGNYPSEVQPLVSDLNLLLDAHDANVARAQAKAGDLAHGLKTPLAVLAQEVDHLRAAGHGELADTITHELARMRRQIDYHLAHARAAASSAAASRTTVREVVDGLRRTMAKLFADKRLIMDVGVAETAAVRCQREDLEEMLGNLLENACKWARSRVSVGASASAEQIAITVDDDGPGIEPAMREAVLLRGVRADQAAPGTGLGLAIVRDLAGLYGGSLSLDASAAGGLRATLTLPRSNEL